MRVRVRVRVGVSVSVSVSVSVGVCEREIGVSSPINQRHDRTLHAQKDALLYALCNDHQTVNDHAPSSQGIVQGYLADKKTLPPRTLP